MTPCSTRNAVRPLVRGGAIGNTGTLYFLVPYRDRHPLSGPLYRLVATARSRGYHSGWLSAPAGPSDLCGSWWQRWGAPATGAAGEYPPLRRPLGSVGYWPLRHTYQNRAPGDTGWAGTTTASAPSGRGLLLGPQGRTRHDKRLALLRADRALGNTEGEGGCPPRARINGPSAGEPAGQGREGGAKQSPHQGNGATPPSPVT